MGDRITERVEALALPWFSRAMRLTTVVVAAALFVPLLRTAASADPVTALVTLALGAVVALAGATVITTGLKLVSLLVRVPLSLYLYPD